MTSFARPAAFSNFLESWHALWRASSWLSCWRTSSPSSLIALKAFFFSVFTSKCDCSKSRLGARQFRLSRFQADAQRGHFDFARLKISLKRVQLLPFRCEFKLLFLQLLPQRQQLLALGSQLIAFARQQSRARSPGASVPTSFHSCSLICSDSWRSPFSINQ